MKSIIATLSITVLFGLNLIAQPLNDHIQNATDLMIQPRPTPFEESDVAFPSATFAGDATQGTCGIGAAGIWYKFTPTKNGQVTAEIFNPAQPIAIFFTGPASIANSGAELTYVDQASNPCDNSPVSWINVTAGTHYYLFMKNDNISDVQINITDAMLAPDNDFIFNATSLNGMEDFVDADIHFLASTNSGDTGAVNCSTAVAGIWYKFTAQVDGQVVAGLNNPPNTSALVFYEAPDENVTEATELTYVNQPSNPCGLSNLTSIMAEAGTTYYIFATTFDAYGTVSVNLSGILGNSEQELNGFTFYPNPVGSELNLLAQNTIEEVSIYSVTGSKVLHEQPGFSQGRLNLSYLNQGIYIMNVTSDGKSASYKIVKK